MLSRMFGNDGPRDRLTDLNELAEETS